MMRLVIRFIGLYGLCIAFGLPFVSAEGISEGTEGHFALVLLPNPEVDSQDILRAIASGDSNSIDLYGPVVSSTYLIGDRRMIGVLDSAEQNAKEGEDPVRDWSLLHPDSVEAKLQRYLVLEYADEASMNIALAALESNPDIESVGVDSPSQYAASPNDTYYADNVNRQWGLFDLNLEGAWDKAKGHAYIGNPDSGLQTDHEDLVANFRPSLSRDIPSFPGVGTGYDNVGSDTSVGYAGHGTHTTGVIAARSNNSLGVAGVCWYCSVAFGKMGNQNNNTKVSKAYEYFAQIGVQATNSSFGNDGYGGCPSTNTSQNAICEAISLMIARGGMIAAVSGNGPDNGALATSVGRSNVVQFPGRDSRVIAVGAVDSGGNRGFFSDYGPELDLVAPGVGILSTFDYGYAWSPAWNCAHDVGTEGSTRYGKCTGTSMSAPFITGLLGLIRSVDPLLNRTAVTGVLLSSGHLSGSPSAQLGHGLPDAELAVDKVLGTVNASIIRNRLTPLFSFYSDIGENSFYTTVPQMGAPAIKGTLRPRPREFGAWGPGFCGSMTSCWRENLITYLPAYGTAIASYPEFPHEVDFGPYPTPKAEVYIFTTEHNPIEPIQPLVPLYRLSYVGANGANSNNVDHVYTTDQTGITTYESVGYKLEGIEGYIFDDDYPQPDLTEKLYRRYNTSRDDHAIFPASKLSEMTAAGYTQTSGNSFIGYVYTNSDTDNDKLIDGFESMIGTCLSDADTDNDGLSDGDEVLGYPRTDPITTVVACGGLGC